MNKQSAGFTPLMGAIVSGHEECAELLITCDQMDFEVGCGMLNLAALIYAIWNYRQHTIDLLLDKGANPNMRGDHCGMNSLMTAAEMNCVQAMISVLESGRVDVNATDDWGRTALICIIDEGEEPRKESVAVLFHHCSLVNATNPNMLSRG